MEPSRLKILAVDDNPDNLIVLKAIIADTFPGAALTTALNGALALDLARAQDPDVILLDIIMPGMDGFDVCRSLKADEQLHPIPVLFLTALRGATEDRVKALEAGAEGFLSKPVDEAELTAQIRAMAKIKAAHRRQTSEQARLAALVAERTQALEQELAGRIRAEEDLARARDFHLSLLNHAPALIWRAGLDTRCNWFNTTWLAFTGRTLEQESGAGWVEGVHPEDLARCVQTYLDAFALRQPFQMEYRLRRHDNQFRWIVDHGRPFNSLGGQFSGYIGYCFDITEHKRAEASLRASLQEKVTLLKEVHHRVKNNLQIVVSLMRLQFNRLQNPESLELMRETQNRVRAMALLHETLYSSNNLAFLDFPSYLQTLSTQLFRSYGPETARLSLRLRVADAPLGLDQAVPCGLIINELLTNALKYAFPNGRSGEITVELQAEDPAPPSDPAGERNFVLRVCDTGVGMPPDFDLPAARSLGLQLVFNLARQLRGAARLEPGPGARLAVTFPCPQDLQPSP